MASTLAKVPPLAITPVMAVLPVPAIVKVRAVVRSGLMSTSPSVSVPPVMLLVRIRLALVPLVNLPVKVRFCVPDTVTAVRVAALEIVLAALMACNVPDTSEKTPLPKPPLLELFKCTIVVAIEMEPVPELLPAKITVPAVIAVAPL